MDITKKIAIEYQGEQHSRPIEYFGGKKSFEKQVALDNRKKEILESNNIRLIYVYKGYNIEDVIKQIKCKKS